MPDTRLFIVLMRDLEGYSSAFTDTVCEIRLKAHNVRVLEMEDVLFHHDSAVLMPENPAGRSSKDGQKDDGADDLGSKFSEQQSITTGIKALALVFKQFELDPKISMTIAGHTDTSGKPKYNFTLSGERALNVLYLLTGERDLWAKVSANRHKIEDYQQIMQYFHRLKGDWDCDPAPPPYKIDNTWGDKTKTATENFLRHALQDTRDSLYIESLIQRIKDDPKKRWPEEAWTVVFDLYTEVLCAEIGVQPQELKGHAAKTLKFVDDKKQWVGCGESFPLDDRQKKNYRSQTNRRVEILFFDEEEKPILSCPEPRDDVHREEECPLWDKTCYLPLYIDPLDLYAVVYHLRFVFYDRTNKKLVGVPDGLKIRAFQNGKEEIPTDSVYRKGVYHVKVKFPTPLNDPKRLSMHFEFEAPERWVCTKDATPAIVILTGADISKIKPQDLWANYYDLPARWTSQQAWLRYEGSDKDIVEGKDKGGNFFSTLRDTLKLKPFGNNKTTPEKPLTFCLDDVVLTDHNLAPLTGNPGKEGALLGPTFEVVDPDVGNHKSYHTKGGIRGRQIPFCGKIIHGVIADNRLYAIHGDRVTAGAFGGHRAAVFQHPSKCPLERDFWQQHPIRSIGHLDLYWIHHQGFEKDVEISYLFNYIRWELKGVKDPKKPSNDPTNQAFQATPDWIDKTINNITAVYNSRDTNTNKETLATIGYEESAAKAKHLVYVRYYLEYVTNGEHTLVEVLPAGAENRSHMGYSNGEIKADENQPDSEGTFTAAHEFGHATSLEDDYTETCKAASYYLPGFLSFTPGSPYYPDAKAMMKANKKMRTRYFWHLAEWLHTHAPNEYRVGQSGYQYHLPHYSLAAGDRLKTYLTYPLEEKNNVTSPTDRRKYDLALYPLGEDQYSKNGLVPGHTLDGILMVLVKMKFEFKSDKDFWDINRLLKSISRALNKHLNAHGGNSPGKWYVEGVHGGPPQRQFKKCLIYFFPRFLVANFPEASDSAVEAYAKCAEVYKQDAAKHFDYAQTKVEYNNLVASYDPEKHFDVIVRSADFFEGHSAVWDAPMGRRLTISYGWFTGTEELLLGEFPKMLGIHKAAADLAANDLLPLVGNVIQNAKIQNF